MAAYDENGPLLNTLEYSSPSSGRTRGWTSWKEWIWWSELIK